MTETNHASEAAASSPSTRDPWSEATPERLDQAARALSYNASQQEGAAKHLLFVAGHRIESLLRQREQMHRDLLACAIATDPSAEFLGGRPYVEFVRPNVPEGVRKLRDDRDAWKHKADTLGGDLNRIRSLVPIMPIAGGEQTTFDAVQAELQRLRDLAERNGKAATERLDQIAAAEREYLRVGSLVLEGDIAAAMRDLANEVEGLRTAGFRHACMAFDTFLRRCGLDGSKLEGLMPVPWILEAAKLLKDAWPRMADNVRKALIEEAQTAISAMRDVGPELAKAGIQVGPRLSHAEAIAQLRGERDRWREKFEMEQSRADASAKRAAELQDERDKERARAEAAEQRVAELALSLAMSPGLRTQATRSKVGPATGQPRTEVPLAADGSGTVVELGEAFRQNLSNAVACLPEGAIDPTTIKIAIRNLHACVADLAKVVERIGAR